MGRLSQLADPKMELLRQHDRLCGAYMRRLVAEVGDIEAHVVAGAGHYIQEDSAEEVSNRLLEFFTRADNP